MADVVARLKEALKSGCTENERKGALANLNRLADAGHEEAKSALAALDVSEVPESVQITDKIDAELESLISGTVSYKELEEEGVPSPETLPFWQAILSAHIHASHEAVGKLIFLHENTRSQLVRQETFRLLASAAIHLDVPGWSNPEAEDLAEDFLRGLTTEDCESGDVRLDVGHQSAKY